MKNHGASRGTVRLNLGCGHISPVGWVNVDGSNRAWLASHWPLLDRLLVLLRILPATEFSRHTKYADLTKVFPWPNQSVDGIYMGEILEHFTRQEGEHVLRECFRVLKPGGIIRIRVPDNAGFWMRYLDEYKTTKEKPREQWDVSHTRWVEMFFRDICVRKPRRFGSMGHYHKWMFDEVSLILAFEKQGFVDVERRRLHDSRIADVSFVETRDDLIVEGIKPF